MMGTRRFNSPICACRIELPKIYASERLWSSTDSKREGSLVWKLVQRHHDGGRNWWKRRYRFPPDAL